MLYFGASLGSCTVLHGRPSPNSFSSRNWARVVPITICTSVLFGEEILLAFAQGEPIWCRQMKFRSERRSQAPVPGMGEDKRRVMSASFRTRRSSTSTTASSSSTRIGSTTRTITMAPRRRSFRSHFSPQTASYWRRLLYRSYPSAEHPTDFINHFLKLHVLLRIDGVSFFKKTDEEADYIEFHARTLEND